MPAQGAGVKHLRAREPALRTLRQSLGCALGETTGGWRAMGTMNQVEVADWRHRGACRTHDPDRLFVTGAAQRQAKIVCRGCPVRLRCLAEALDRRIEFGVWGGMTERERRALLHRRPDVRNWAELLEGAAQHQA